MSPLDDELRSLLHSRADLLSPAPDPLVGIERRAARMRRTRVASSMVAAAMAVGVVALAVPSVVHDHAARTEQVATTPPTPSPVPTPSPSSAGAAEDGVLNPADPWVYRGNRNVIADVSTLQAEWSAVHPGAQLTPLYGEVYESSQKPQITFASTGGGDRWGVATSSEAGWTFLHDEVLTSGTKVLMAALPADEVPRLLVIAAPTTGQLEYAKDGSSFGPIAGRLPGVGYVPLEGDTSGDAVRVLDGNGDIDHPVFQGPAPDYQRPTPAPASRGPQETTSAPALAARYAFNPDLPWKYRGTSRDGYGDIVSTDRKQFVTDHGERQGQQDTPLYVVHLSATTDVAVVLHARPGDDWVSFTAHQGSTTHQLAYQPTAGEDILSAYLALDSVNGLLIAVASDSAASLVLQTGSRAEVGGSRTAGIWDWAPHADPQARLAVYAAGDIEPYSSQPAT